MKALDKAFKINVEEMRLRLLQRKITRPRFRLNLTEEQATDLLLSAYQSEVDYRKREFQNDAQTLENVRKFAQYLTGNGKIPKFGCMLAGTCGNGKTTLVYAFQNLLNWLVNQGFFDDEKDYDGKVPWGITIVSARDILNAAKNPQEFRRLKERTMLAIDDLGTEATEVLDYGNVLSPLVDLMEARYITQSFTLVTTNLTGKEVREKYGTRIADRFNEMMDVIIFPDHSYRR